MHRRTLFRLSKDVRGQFVRLRISIGVRREAQYLTKATPRNVPDVSVRTAWEVLLPAGTVLLAGEAGLDRSVTWPVVLRTHPPAFDPLRGGELAIVPLDRLHLLDSSLTLARVITQLSRMRVGAVCAIGPVHEDAVAASGNIGIPLFRLPDGSNASDVHQAFMRSLAEHHVELSNRIGEIGRELNTLAIDGRGRTAIARRAGQLADTIAAVEDESGRLLFVYTPPGARLDRVGAARLIGQLQGETGVELSIGGQAASNVKRFRLGDHVSALSAPVRGRFRPAGRLLLLTVGRELAGLDAAILEQAVAACAIDLAREEAATAARDELLGDFLDDLLRRAFPSDEAIERRGRNLGYDLSLPHVVMAVRLSEATSQLDLPDLRKRGATDVALPPELSEATIGEIVATCDGVLGPVAVHMRGDALIVLAPLAPDAIEMQGPEIGRRIAARLIDLAGAGAASSTTASIGLGGFASGGTALAEASERALQALTIGARLLGPGQVTPFEDLGLYRLLFALRGIPEVTAFYRDMLGRLIEHDRRTGAELVRTLDAYLSVGCSPTAAAERLHLHRNGLLYRLQRIREIVPVNLDDPERRLALHLALRIGEVVESATAVQIQRIA